MQQAAARSNGDYSNSTVLSLGNQVRAFDGVNSDINLRTACTNLFANIKHRCLVHFALANYYSTLNINGIEGSTHSVDSQAVGTVFITSAYKMTAGDGCSLGNTYKLQRKLSVHYLHTP